MNTFSFFFYCNKLILYNNNILQILRDAFKRYRSDQMFISFNGGKDCTVLLHLVQTVISELRNESSSGPDDVLCLYLQPANPFDEVEVFVAQCATEYSVNLLKTPSGSKTKQESLFEVCDRNPELKACLMGCRRSDPWCDKLHHFEVIIYIYETPSSDLHILFI